jgi:hypothetical protein
MKKISFILVAILFFSCKKEEVVSDIPSIEFKLIAPTTAQEYTDDIIITISYTDENGDLGENNPDVFNLFVKDSRNDIEYKFRIPELSPNGNDITIQGNFNITINGSGITDESSSQQVNYSIYVKDRAGNNSDTITTSSITIQQ